MLYENYRNKNQRSRGKFLDYLQGGCELSLMVAIDFTGSNGHVSDPQSLHYIYKQFTPSPYQAALREICPIVATYDSDQKFPVWGFGAKFPQNNTVSHDFVVNPSGEEVDGVNGVEEAYLTAIQSNAFQLSGPCCYSPILTKAINETIVSHNEVMQNESLPIQYYILLILTNGECCDADKQQTKNLLIYASNNNLPLSIIFVGIGQNKFDFLNELDGDFDPIKDDKGNVAKRDIVQFVAMKDFVNKPNNELSKYTLREIPIQFVSYVDNNNLPPRKNRNLALSRTASKFYLEEEEDENGRLHSKGDTMFEISQNELDAVSDEEEEVKEEINATKDPMEHVPVPVGWEKSYTATGRPFYLNHKLKTTQWEHPLKGQMNRKQSTQQTELQRKQAAAYNLQLMNNNFDSNVMNKPIQRSATFQPQTSPTIQRTATFQPIAKSQTMYQPQQQQQSAVYGQRQNVQNVVYAQPQQPPQQRVIYTQPQQQRIAYDQYGRQMILQQQPQQVIYAQPQQVQYAQPQQGQPVYYVQQQQPYRKNM